MIVGMPFGTQLAVGLSVARANAASCARAAGVSGYAFTFGAMGSARTNFYKDAFARQADIHRETAARVLHKAPEEITADERSMAKMVNFGLAYGMSDFGLASRANISTYASMWWPKLTGCATCRCVNPGMIVAACVSAWPTSSSAVWPSQPSKARFPMAAATKMAIRMTRRAIGCLRCRLSVDVPEAGQLISAYALGVVVVSCVQKCP